MTLGCPRNEADSERYAGILASAGWLPAASAGTADLVLLNTCAFISPAVEESLEAIREAVDWKSRRPGRRLILAGCLPGRCPDDGSGGLEDFDLVMGPADFAGLARHLGTSPVACARLAPGNPPGRFVKIAEGCGNACAFCTLPSIRGPHRPESADAVRRETDLLVAQGAMEIGLVAQDPCSWTEGRMGLPDLLDDLAGRHPETWFRLYYLHPAGFDPRLLEVMAGRANITRYLDIPVQHASDRILRRMGRGYGRGDLERLFGMVEDSGMEIACRLTVITGYPGETRDDFEELLSMLSGCSCMRSLAVFTYWHEEGTAEHRRGEADHVPSDVAAERLMEVDSISVQAAAAWGDRLAGRRIRTLSESTGGGRSEFDAPSVDGSVIYSSPVRRCAFVDAEVEDSDGLDLFVRPFDGN